MEARAKLIAYLKDPDGTWENEYAVQYEDAEALKGEAAAVQLIHKFVLQLGGLYRRISDLETDFIPMMRVRNINVQITVPIVELADATALAAIERRKPLEFPGR